MPITFDRIPRQPSVREAQPRSKKVRMLKTSDVSQDGWDNDTFFKDEVHSVTPRLYVVLVDGGIAEDYKPKPKKRRGRKPAEQRARKVTQPLENKAALGA